MTHDGRVAVVTGAARGIGAAISNGLAQADATVVGIDVGDLRDTERTVKAAGGKWLGLTLDVTSAESVSQAASAVIGSFGRCDILINNAATLRSGAFLDTTLEDWHEVMRVNVDSVFLMLQSFVPLMRERHWGRVVNLVSTTIMRPLPNQAAYITSKLALVGLTRSLAVEWGNDGITINALCPSLTLTPGVDELGDGSRIGAVAQMQAIKRPAVPEDLLGAVLFLSGDSSAFMTGQTLLVNGGLAFV